MWLVLAALRRPISIFVIVLSLILCSLFAIKKMSIDIFPSLGDPMILIGQPYGGLSPAQMEGFITVYTEFHFFYVGGIKEVETHNIQGIAVIKLTFYPGTNMGEAMAEVSAMVERARAFAPPGTVSPFLVRFDAGSVPIGDLVFTSKTRTLAEIQDEALYKVRPMFASLPGVSSPPPVGGNQRTIVIHVDPVKLRQYQISGDQVIQALNKNNIVTPAGNVRVGNRALIAANNTVVPNIQMLADIPIMTGQGPTVFIRDVGWIEDSSDIVAGYALVDGKRAIYIPVTKRSNASTWTVVQEVKKALPLMQEAMPEDVKVSYEFDQSYYVKNALVGLMFEGTLGACLTALVILYFLRNFRSAFIVIITIPIAVLAAVFALFLCGQTINIMTLGGLALAIGILVDNITVTIENVFSHHARGKSFPRAVVDSASEISVTNFLVLICVLAVFVPSFFMEGVTGALFIPMSLAVGFSMIASFLLSQTFVPIMIIKLLSKHPMKQHDESHQTPVMKFYSTTLNKLMLSRRKFILAYFVGCIILLMILIPMTSIELFPSSDAGQFRVRVRAPIGTRIEHTEDIAHQMLNLIYKTVGRDKVATNLSYVGMQPTTYPNINFYIWTSGPHEAIMNVALKKDAKISIPKLKEILRKEVAKQFPQLSISFEPGDLVGQTTSMGSPTPIEVALVGRSLDDDRAFAAKLKPELAKIPEIRDLQIGEALDYPSANVTIDRIRAGQLGVTVSDIAKSLVAATSSSRFTVPVYWLDANTGTSYNVQVEMPQYLIASLEDLKDVPAILNNNNKGPFLRDVATVEPGVVLGEIHRLNARRILTLTANFTGDNMHKVSNEVKAAIKRAGKPPRGMMIKVRSQLSLLEATLKELESGLLLAICAIFLLLSANFQSFKLALISLTTVPAVLVGSVLILLLSGTSINIQSYLGIIMSMGISVANSILLVTFAETRWHETGDSTASALQAGMQRIRPIMMTAIAMLAGMVPMALALSEGGDQTAPLGRAVIGGLFVSTFATLFILPLVFSLARANTPRVFASLDPDDRSSEYFEDTKKEG